MRLILPPQYGKPCVRRGKNDRKDAEAICAAAGSLGRHFVPAKSVTQAAQSMVLKVRETLVGQRTLLAATEKWSSSRSEAKEMACLLAGQIEEPDTRIQEIEAKLAARIKPTQPSSVRPRSTV